MVINFFKLNLHDMSKFVTVYSHLYNSYLIVLKIVEFYLGTYLIYLILFLAIRMSRPLNKNEIRKNNTFISQFKNY